MSKIKKTLKEAGKILANALSKELESQGHRASSTSSIIDSFRVKATDRFVEITTDKSYANVLQTGIRKGGKFPNREAIEDWVRKKGFARNETEVKQIAYAVGLKIQKEGVPTNESFRHSKNGRRIGFIDQVLKENEDNITEMIMNALTFDVEVMFNKLPKEL